MLDALQSLASALDVEVLEQAVAAAEAAGYSEGRSFLVAAEKQVPLAVGPSVLT